MGRPTGITAKVMAEGKKPATRRSVRAYCRRRFEETFKMEWPRTAAWLLLPAAIHEDQDHIVYARRLLVEEHGANVLRAIRRLRAACGELAAAREAARAAYDKASEALMLSSNDEEPDYGEAIEAFLPELSLILSRVRRPAVDATFDGFEDASELMSGERARVVANSAAFAEEYGLPLESLRPRELAWLCLLSRSSFKIFEGETIAEVVYREREGLKKTSQRLARRKSTLGTR